jgi:hypothetical protein
MRPIPVLAALAVLLSLPAAPALAQYHGDDRASWNGGWNGGWSGNQLIRLRCESWNYREATCAAPVPIASVRLARVIAGDCRDRTTWRWDRGAIQVRGGCRADFDVIAATSQWGGNQWSGRDIACESWNWRPANCPVPGARGVRLARVLGGTCIEGRTWMFNRGQIQVRDGCRARFSLY